MVNIKSKLMTQFPQLLCVPNSSDKRWLKSSSARFNARRQRPHRDQMGKESAMFSNQDIKGPIFPKGRARPLKGGQLLAAQFNQKIKHRGVLYRERVGKRNGHHLSRSAVIFKTCFRRFVQSRRTNYVSANSLRRDREKFF